MQTNKKLIAEYLSIISLKLDVIQATSFLYILGTKLVYFLYTTVIYFSVVDKKLIINSNH